jgi:two-component system NtrC family sensor kinase
MRRRRSPNQISLKWKVIIPVAGIVLTAFSGYAYFSLATIPFSSSLVRTQLLASAGITLAMLVGALIIVIYVLVNRPVTELASAMRRVEDGDLSARAVIRSGDELEELAETFNHMLDELQVKNRQLVEAGRQLLQSEKLASIGLLASGVAHEINNPVATISVSAESLLETEDQPDRRRFLQAILEESDRISGIVRKLLDFDRGGHARFSECDLSEVVGQAMDDVRREAERSQVRLGTDLELRGAKLLGQPDQLRQALGNILDNAIRSMAEGGDLRVTGRVAGLEAILRFSDTGSGISEEDLAHIFDPFFSTREVGEGFGLGLSVTYEVVRRHHGGISVDSGPQGTTFSVTLPLVAPGEPD